jgi:hypothetical protein
MQKCDRRPMGGRGRSVDLRRLIPEVSSRSRRAAAQAVGIRRSSDPAGSNAA